jgi:non-specific serine/threonine protein kinase/serine/threonine-protein kinase
MDTRQVIARFGQERQALATMDHPHIAKVLDAGTTASGLPYFVMELVKGETITRFCDQAELSVAERLDLFLQVASAIQHAHLKGIVHRDIKPSNVLTTMREDGPHATVIDFGIAKAIEEPLYGETPRTRLGQIIGTPLYMSPEQSEGGAAVDTRTDVYSLGVLLYELLTGSPPIDLTALDETPRQPSELWRILRDLDPPRPSTRVSSSPTLGELAARRATEPRRLQSMLRGELDWIVMRALEKAQDRRYQTVNAFALDVQNHLAGRPVVAAPPSAVYRMRKFVARYRGPVIAAAVGISALVVGLGGTIWQARVAARERDSARQEAARANALNEFMTRMLTASDPESLGSREVTVMELLDRASQTVDETLEGAAEVQARALSSATRCGRSARPRRDAPSSSARWR